MSWRIAIIKENYEFVIIGIYRIYRSTKYEPPNLRYANTKRRHVFASR